MRTRDPKTGRLLSESSKIDPGDTFGRKQHLVMHSELWDRATRAAKVKP